MTIVPPVVCFAVLRDNFLPPLPHIPPPTQKKKLTPKSQAKMPKHHSHVYLFCSCTSGHLLSISRKIKNPILMYTHLYPYCTLGHFSIKKSSHKCSLCFGTLFYKKFFSQILTVLWDTFL